MTHSSRWLLWPRPKKALLPVVSTAVLLAGWAGIAHESGVGWVQAIGAIIAAALLLGLVIPAVALLACSVTLKHCPSDARAGEPIVLSLEINRPLRIRCLDPLGSETPAPRSPVEMSCVQQRRGVITHLDLEVSSAAPFGLLWWTRKLRIDLAQAIYVAPRLGSPESLAAPEEPSANHGRLQRAQSGEPRGVMPYHRGDRWRDIHWPASAHTGSLVVRDRETTISKPLIVSLDLPLDEDLAEAVAERALGTILAALSRGDQVILITHEAGGRVSAPVRDRISAGRRLARAVALPGAMRAELHSTTGSGGQDVADLEI